MNAVDSSITTRDMPEKYFNKLFINNTWLDSTSGLTYNVTDPATESVITSVQEASVKDVDAAVNAAQRAFDLDTPWRTMDASKRGQLLFKMADLMTRDSEYINILESKNCGKVLTVARKEIKLIIEVVRYYAGLADKVHGKTIPTDDDVVCMTRTEPIGVCALILSWNYPLLMLASKLSVALACGNTVVIKPAQQTPLTALYLCSLVLEAGFPPGVVNLVTGTGSCIGRALTEHPGVGMLSFTGSTKVGQIVQEAAARSNCKRTVLSLSGKSPVAVFPDAQMEKAVVWCHRAIFTNSGQICCAGSRIYVHDDIYEEFVQRSVELAKKIVVGDPLHKDTTQGPQIDSKSLSFIESLIESAIKQGAKLELGGHRHGGKGFYLQPTIFSEVLDHMEIAREEVFGPVQLFMRFKTLDEVIQRSNDTRYGLVAAVFSKDINTALMYAQGVRAGTIWINTYLKLRPQTPYGGFKMSGHGKELGKDTIKDYTQSKTITISIPKKNS